MLRTGKWKWTKRALNVILITQLRMPLVIRLRKAELSALARAMAPLTERKTLFNTSAELAKQATGEL